MSTISKALDKQKHNPQVVISEHKSGRMTLGIVTGIMFSLLAVIIWLLIENKPDWLAGLVTSKQQQQVESFQLSEAPERVSTVTDITFDTKPLPIIVEEEPVKFISPEKPQRKLQVSNNNRENRVTEDLENQQALADVPEDLKALFAKAVAEENKLQEQGEEEVIRTVPVNDISKMPIPFQFKVPLMRYDSHVYSSKESDRWIRINGTDLRVGDFVGPVQLVKIMPQRSEFRLGEQSFTLESLTDWEG